QALVTQTCVKRILAAADKLFYTKGIRAVGVDTVAAEAGVSKRTLYNHYPSKDALIAAYLQARFKHIAPSDAPAREQILGAFERLERMFADGSFRGAIRYIVSAPITALRACHCANCQRASGSGGTVNAVVPSDSFKITKGATRRYDDSATQSGRTLSRHFCADCGSPIYSHRN